MNAFKRCDVECQMSLLLCPSTEKEAKVWWQLLPVSGRWWWSEILLPALLGYWRGRKLRDFLSDACLCVRLELNCSRSYSKDNPDFLNRNYQPKVEGKTKELLGRVRPSCMSCREVFDTMPLRKDFTSSFPCNILQEGDETRCWVVSSPRPAATSILQF